MKEGILEKSDNVQGLDNKKFSIKAKIDIILASLMLLGLLATISLLIFNKGNFSSNSALRLLKEEDDYSFICEYTIESENKTIEIINSKFKNIISKLKIDGELKEPCTSYNFKSKGIHKIHFTLNLQGVTSFAEMFYNNNNLISITFSPSFNTENITLYDRTFSHCYQLQSIDLSHFNFTKADSLFLTFAFSKSLKTIDLSNINAQNLTDMSGTFYGAESITFINLTNFNAPKLWQMIHTFRECPSLISIDFSNFRAPKLKTLQNAFYQSTSLKSIDLSSIESDDFNTLIDTFYDCHSIEYIKLPKTTKKAMSMSRTFTNCYSLKSIDLTNCGSSYISEKDFVGCTNLSYIDLSTIDRVSEKLFENLPKAGEIKLSKKVYNDIQDYIPEDWTVILVK